MFSSPLATARWYEATEVAQVARIHKQIEVFKQYASTPYRAPELMVGAKN